MLSSLAFAFPLLAATLSNAYDHRVVVGGPGLLAYTPPTVKANVGDSITFEFHEKNHTATQAAFDSPCSPLSGGFNSGFRPVAPGTTSGFPTYTVSVLNDKPIWVYCAQPGPPAHCSQGMVFAVNAPDYGNTFEAFKAKALALANTTTTTRASTSTSDSRYYSTQSHSQYEDHSTSSANEATKTLTVTQTVTSTVSACSTSVSSTSTPVTHKIVVGGTKDGAPLLAFTPPTVVANVGDFIEFEFQVKNHTVTQSQFSNPCSSVETTTGHKKFGFDSGFMPVAANASLGPTFKIRVNDTKPIWGYCRQQGPPIHCQKGMVFGINPPTEGPNTFGAFQQLAMHLNLSTPHYGDYGY